ncbi:MAG: hypothetical protein HY329_15930, partial [Chloroflexi bacterium]|nr:hypothetical protein [Chloroflexota bacterium]
FIYVGYLMLRAYTAENPSSAKYAAVLGIIGFFDVPIIHQSVVWWRSLHPEPVVLNSRTGPQLPTEMLAVLLVALLAFTLLYVFLMLQKYTIERARDELRLIQAQLSADAVDDLSVTPVTPIASPAGRGTNQFPLPLREG